MAIFPKLFISIFVALESLICCEAAVAQDIAAMNDRTLAIYRSRPISEAVDAAQQAVDAAQRKGIVDAAFGTALGNKAELLRRTGHPSDAIRFFENARKIYEQIGQTNDAQYSYILANLGSALSTEHQYARAEPLFLKSVSVQLNLRPIDADQLAITYNKLGDLKAEQNLNNEAFKYYSKALDGLSPASEQRIYSNLHIAAVATDSAISERALRAAIKDMLSAQSPDYVSIAKAARDLGQTYAVQRRYDLALNSFGDAEQYLSKSSAADASIRFSIILGKAGAFRDSARLDEADALYRNARTLLEKSLNSDLVMNADLTLRQGILSARRQDFSSAKKQFESAISLLKLAHEDSSALAAQAFASLGFALNESGQTSEAIQNLEAALSIYRKAVDERNGVYAAILSNLGLAYLSKGRFSEARPLLEESERVTKVIFSDRSRDYASSLINLADLCDSEGRWSDAKQYGNRALAILGDAPSQSKANALNRLGLAEMNLKEFDAAVAHLELARSIARSLPGSRSSLVGILRNLAGAYQYKGRDNDAISANKEQLTVVAALYGADNTEAAPVLFNLGWLYFERGAISDAISSFERGNRILLDQLDRDWVLDSFDVSVNRKQRLPPDGFVGYVQASSMLKLDEHGALEQAKRSFETAQWAQIVESSYSIGLRAARVATKDPQLQDKLRTREEAAVAVNRLQSALIAMYAAPTSDADATARVRGELEAAKSAATKLDGDLRASEEKFMLLAKPTAVSVAELQASLQDDEALINILPSAGSMHSKGETFIWVVTKAEVHMFSSPMSEAVVNQFVKTLRCGLDKTLWGAPNTCANLVGSTPDENAPLPFRMDLAYALYWQLLAPTEPYVRGKKLLIVSPGELATLPFETLPTSWPDYDTRKFADDYSKVNWLIKEHSISILPSVASLRLLRLRNDVGKAELPFAGFGNPTLKGDGSCASSLTDSVCPAVASVQLKHLGGETRAVPAKQLLRNGTERSAIARNVESLCPLPATALEINCIAAELGGNAFLADKFTRHDIDALSQAGTLAKYRVIDFATHGVLPGEDAGQFLEPALVVTPTATDDGLLRSSNIAQLRLNADWVILAACNTGSGSGGMRGLADAFFFAGARGLLISNWNTNSTATLMLSLELIRAARSNPKMSLADAHRASVLSLISDANHSGFSHPEFWAPFTVVGGSAGRH